MTGNSAHMLRTALLAALVTSSVAVADECTPNAALLVPQFAARQPKGVKVTTKKDKRHLRQSTKYPDGVELTVDLTACERLRYSLEIKNAGVSTKTVGAEVLAVARRALTQMVMVSNAAVEPKVLLAGLDDSSFVALPATFSCGTSGTCRLELVADPVKKKPAPKKKPKESKDSKEKDAKVDDADGPAHLVLSFEAGGD